MTHIGGPVPRLVCAQGLFSSHPAAPASENTDPSVWSATAQTNDHPLYRHPSDTSPPLHPFTPPVSRIAAHAARIAGHPLNHCLLQLYRSGQDFISEHADKTLDLVRGSSVVNVSLGARRVMRLRAKRGYVVPLCSSGAKEPEHYGAGDTEKGPAVLRDTQHIPLPHGSVFVLGPRTNGVYLHSIPADKREVRELEDEESAFGGERISLTFRWIGTFLDGKEERIWGVGARGKERRDAGLVLNGGRSTNVSEDDMDDPTYAERQRLLFGFGRENQGLAVGWDECYGAGSDVLHLARPEKKRGGDV